MALLVQLVSLLGAALVLVAFVGLQRSRWSSTHATYLWLNVIGAGLLTFVAVHDRRAGFVVLEGVWTVVSAAALITTRARR